MTRQALIEKQEKQLADRKREQEMEEAKTAATDDKQQQLETSFNESVADDQASNNKKIVYAVIGISALAGIGYYFLKKKV